MTETIQPAEAGDTVASGIGTIRSLDEQVLEAATGTLELFGVYLGGRLGLYDALQAGGPMTPSELATETGIHTRYAREWLEQQAVSGVLTVDDLSAPPEERRFALPAAHVGVVLDPTDELHVAPLAHMVVGIANALEDVTTAYRTGGGFPYSRYGLDFRHGQGGINRPAFSTALVEQWLPTTSLGVDPLRAGGRIADIGCGQGWSAIALAQAFPDADVWGIDNDEASIEDARVFASEAGVEVHFECADAATLAASGPFDMIVVLEVLHDLAQPVRMLDAARAALAEDGCVVVADEAVASTFHAPGDQVERMMYGWSISHCLPASMVEEGSAAIGTVIREDHVRHIATDAGFGHVDVLDVDGGFFRLYELRT